jgi:hypothetical protein
LDVAVSETDFELLVPGGQDFFQRAVSDYGESLFAEAKSIEGMEHTGSGPPEITAAHVDEARWVLARRRRIHATHSKWAAFTRIAQLLATTTLGVGASNLKDTWGAVLSLVSVLIAALLFILERELTRD